MLWTPKESIAGRLWDFGQRGREVGRENKGRIERGRDREGGGVGGGRQEDR